MCNLVPKIISQTEDRGGGGGGGLMFALAVALKDPYLVSEPSPAKPNGHKINVYFKVNQGIISCSALCIMCLSRGADNVQQR